MQQNRQFDDNTIKTHSKTVWMGMQSSSLTLAVAIFILDNFGKLDPFLPEYKTIFIGLCVFSIPLCFVLISRFRESERAVRNNIHSGIDNDQPILQSYMKWMIFGMFLCDMPAMFGLVLYMACGEMMLALFFIFVSFVCGFLYKPNL